MKVVLVIIAFAAALAAPLVAPPTSHAGPLGTTIPSNCVPHSSFSGGADAAGDYRCAGLAIHYHSAGVNNSPFPIWAGQWLFTDEDDQYRVGSCTLNRGEHPTIAQPSRPVSQSFPKDADGAKGAYLSWKYGDTTDNLTAAAMWVVFHFYAQDHAGTARANVATYPLVPRLEMVGQASGRDDLQALAIALDAEAAAHAGEWRLDLALTADGRITAAVSAGTQPVVDQPVTVLITGVDDELVLTTGADGVASASIDLPEGATTTVVASVEAPGSTLVFRGTPATPDPHGAQTMVTGGDSTVLRTEASIEVAAPTTTTTMPATTTTMLATTTMPATTTTMPATTTTAVPETTTTTTPTVPETTTTVPATTTIPDSTTTTSAIVVVLPAPSTRSALPKTGSDTPNRVAYLATAMLVGGAGLIGSIRRRAASTPDDWMNTLP